MENHRRIWYMVWRTVNDIMQVFMKEFNKRFKNDRELAPQNAIPFYKDITETYSEWLTRDATNEEIRDKQSIGLVHLILKHHD